MGCRFFALHDWDEKKKAKGAFEVDLNDADKFNKAGYAIYWVLNEFKEARKKENLTKITHWFADLDEGSKEEMMKRIEALTLPPSFIIETQKGFHCYWAVEGEATIDNFEVIQKGICKKLKGDPHCVDVLRLLRAPGFLHQKDPKHPFEIQLLDGNNTNYYIGVDKGYSEKQMLYYFSEEEEPKQNKVYKPTMKDNVSDFLKPERWDKLFKISEIVPGVRNGILYRYSLWLKDEGLSDAEISYVIHGINERTVAPLSTSEVQTILRGK